MFLFWFLYICRHRLVKHLILFFFKYSILVQIALNFSNRKIIQKDINLLLLCLSPLLLNVLRYPIILGIIKTDGLIALSNFMSIKYLELAFVLTNFEITI